MKALRYLVFFAIVVSALVYAQAGAGGRGVVMIGDALWDYRTRVEPSFDVIELIDAESQTWYYVTGGDDRAQLRARRINVGEDVNMIIDEIRQIRGQRESGSIRNLLIGRLPDDVVEEGVFDIERLFPSNPDRGLNVILRGTTIGTVISRNARRIVAGTLKNYAGDGAWRGAGVRIQTREGNMGGTDERQGWLGVPPDFPNDIIVMNMSDNCIVRDVNSRVQVNYLDVHASGRVNRRGRPTSRLRARVDGGEAVMYNQFGWRGDRFRRVRPIVPIIDPDDGGTPIVDWLFADEEYLVEVDEE